MQPCSTKQQQEFLSLLADLLANGFTLQESFLFMKKVLPKERTRIIQIEQRLSRGIPLHVQFAILGYPANDVTQLNLAELHGDLQGTLVQLNHQMVVRKKQQQELRKAISYPLILVFFLSLLLIAMKFFLLPQLRSIGGASLAHNPGVWIVERFPWLMLLQGSVLGGGAVGWRWFTHTHSALATSEKLAQIPGVRQIYRPYQTAFFANEWGKLMKQGIELQGIITVMTKKGNTPLMREIGVVCDQSLGEGVSLARQVARWSFFLPELALIIQQGEAKGKLGDELILYSSRLQQQMIAKIYKWVQLIQPIIFLGIAGLIIAIYSALLLPIYGGLEGLE